MGMVLAFAQTNVTITLTHELIFDVILPPLLFEAALAIHWKELRRDALPVLMSIRLGELLPWNWKPVGQRSQAA
jgi:CPA1 family monovalent cation:H+ antiporter